MLCLFCWKERAVLRGNTVNLESALHQRQESDRLAVLPPGYQTHQLPHHQHGK